MLVMITVEGVVVVGVWCFRGWKVAIESGLAFYTAGATTEQPMRNSDDRIGKCTDASLPLFSPSPLRIQIQFHSERGTKSKPQEINDPGHAWHMRLPRVGHLDVVRGSRWRRYLK